MNTLPARAVVHPSVRDHLRTLEPQGRDDPLDRLLIQRTGTDNWRRGECKTVATLAVFAVFSVRYLGERLNLNHLVGFGLIRAGAFFVFKGPIPH